MGELTPKQDRFCREYVIDLNGSAAAIRAGYAKKSARIAAARLLTNDNIQKRVAELAEAVSERVGLTSEGVLQRLEEIAFADPDETIRTQDILRALELLGKHLALFTERHEHQHSGHVNFNMVVHKPAT